MTESRFPPVEVPDTRVAKELQRFCLTFDGAWEDYPWGDVVYKVGSKIFCFLGLGCGMAGITIKATQDDADALCQLPHIERARYIGRYGWVSVSIEDEGDLGPAFDLIDAGYGLVRGKRRKI